MDQRYSMGFQPFGAFAESRAQRLIKTLSYSGTSGALTLESLDREIERLVNYNNVVRLNVPRKPGESDAYKEVVRTAGVTPGEFVAETEDFTDDEGSYVKVPFAYKTLGARGKITRFAEATGKSFGNALATELDGKTEDFKDYEEWGLFYGTGSANQFTGLHYLIDNGNLVNQHVGCTTGVGLGSLTIAKMDELWDKTRFFPNLAFTSKKGARIINSLLQTYQRFNDKVEVNGGFVVSAYNGTPILKSNRVVDVIAWGGTTVSAITGGYSSIIYTVNTEKFFISELTPLTMMMLARASSQYESFDLFEDIVPVLRNPYHAALLAGFAD